MQGSGKATFNGAELTSAILNQIAGEAVNDAPPHHLHAQGYDDGYTDGYAEGAQWAIDSIRKGELAVMGFFKGIADASTQAE